MKVILIRPWQARLIMALAFALFLAGGYHLAVPSPMMPALGPPPKDEPLFSVPNAEGLVGLAVNVDWGSDHLPSMLDQFRQADAKVTFFLTGRWAEQNTELARLLVEDGHEVGNHGLSHVHPKQLDERQLAEHIEKNQQVLESIVGKVSQLYAPPYGEWDRRLVRQVAALGYRTVLWTLDTIDWQDPPPERILQRVLPKVQSGHIILMHPTATTVRALPQLLRGLEEKGLRAVTLSTMLAASEGQPQDELSISRITAQQPGSS
ncbi:MAG: polysaccharide deacetylase family protein [Limnochordia bacterium]|jgi:peptidoglycan/xylan/chitin deacetylase (PgdA/CDA1 family)